MGLQKQALEIEYASRLKAWRKRGDWNLYSSGKPNAETEERYKYDRLTEILFVMFDDEFKFRVEEFRKSVKEYRSKQRKNFRQLVEEIFNADYDMTHLKGSSQFRSFDDIPYSTTRFRECQICGRVFYCTANGKTNVCHYVREENGKSACFNARHAANQRKSATGSEEYKYSGSFGELSATTRDKYEREMFVNYDATAKQGTPDWKFYQRVMAAGSFNDPQDIVCGTAPTHRSTYRARTRMPFSRNYDTGGAAFMSVDIASGEVAAWEADKAVIFEKKLLEIKKSLPIKPRNPLTNVR